MEIEEEHFIAAPFHCQTVSFVKSDLLGENDETFSRFFSSGDITTDNQRVLWMKFHALRSTEEKNEDDENERERYVGYEFLMLDPLDGFLWSQNVNNSTEISKNIAKYNPGIEMEECDIFRHLSEAVSGQKKIRWRFAEKVVHEKKELLPSKVLGYISFRCMIGKIGFDFKFDCVRLPSSRNSLKLDTAFAHLVQPLFWTTQYLLESRESLYKIIEEKDAEIAGYKQQGAVLSESQCSLVSSEFNRKEFDIAHQKKFKFATLAEASSAAKVTDLYGAIMLVRLEKKLQESTLLYLPHNLITNPKSPSPFLTEEPIMRHTTSESMNEDLATSSVSEQPSTVETTVLPVPVPQPKVQPVRPKKKRGIL